MPRDLPEDQEGQGFQQGVGRGEEGYFGQCPPPRAVQEMFNVWSQSVKKQRQWTLDALAKSINIITCPVHNHQEKLLVKGECVSTDYKIIALVLMCSFFITKINLAESNCQSQNKAVAMNLQQQQQKQKSTKPHPPNFQYDASKVGILCLC